jgi:hypothetical protein
MDALYERRVRGHPFSFVLQFSEFQSSVPQLRTLWWVGSNRDPEILSDRATQLRDSSTNSTNMALGRPITYAYAYIVLALCSCVCLETGAGGAYSLSDPLTTRCELEAINVGTRLGDAYNSFDEETGMQCAVCSVQYAVCGM